MPALTANILTEGRLVQLDLGGATQVLRCRVLGYGGTDVVLAPIAPPPPSTLELIESGRDGYLIVDVDAQVHALRSRVRTMADHHEIVVSVTDAFRLGQRRRYSRAPLALPATIRPQPGGESWETVTRDISAGGLRVARTQSAGEQADALEIVIEVAHAGLRIRAAADVVRRTPADLSLHFTEIEEQDVRLLQQIAVAFYRP